MLLRCRTCIHPAFAPFCYNYINYVLMYRNWLFVDETFVVAVLISPFQCGYRILQLIGLPVSCWSARSYASGRWLDGMWATRVWRLLRKVECRPTQPPLSTPTAFLTNYIITFYLTGHWCDFFFCSH